jgi:hypothetical protein
MKHRDGSKCPRFRKIERAEAAVQKKIEVVKLKIESASLRAITV